MFTHKTTKICFNLCEKFALACKGSHQKLTINGRTKRMSLAQGYTNSFVLLRSSISKDLFEFESKKYLYEGNLFIFIQDIFEFVR